MARKTKAPRPRSSSSSSARPGIKITAERVRVNRQGYDGTGRYWGVGEKLWRVVVVDKGTDIYNDTHVRASNAREAKSNVIAQMMRSLSEDQRGALSSAQARGRGRAARMQPQSEVAESTSLVCPRGHGPDLYFNHADNKMHCNQCGATAVAPPSALVRH